MRIKPQRLLRACAALTVAAAVPALGATAQMESTVVRTLAAENGIHGGCMARLARSVNDATGLDCSDRWVAFSCAGEHTSASEALRLFDSAQLAFVTGRRVIVTVDDARKHGGFCFASRVDVLADES